MGMADALDEIVGEDMPAMRGGADMLGELWAET